MTEQQMNSNPTYQQPSCTPCAACNEPNTTTTRKRDVNETKTIADDTARRVPQLRFPEFQNAGEWELVTLKDIGKTYNGLSGKNGEDFGEGEPYVTYKQVFNGEPIKIEECSLVTFRDGEKQHKLKKGDILVTISSETAQEIGMANVITENFKTNVYLNSFCFIFRPYNNCLIPSFAKYLFNSSSYRKQIVSIAQGITRYNISKDNFLNLKLYIPNSQEQQKVASCLLSIDDEIVANTQKLEQLKTHKNALLQKLFPQRGKTTPELRFPEFQNVGEWEENTLGGEFGICELRNGYTPSKENDQFWSNGTIPWFRMEDIRKHGRILVDSIQHITPEAVKGELFEAGSIIMSTTATIGEYALIISDSLANQRFTNLKIRKSRKDDLDTYFLFYYCHYISEWCKRNTNTGGLLSVDIDGLKRYKLYIPNDINEQKKIAKIMRTIDDSIKATEQIIEILKLHKNGLMQQLFP